MSPDPSIYEALRDALRAEEPVALATVTAGPRIGAKLLVPRVGDALAASATPTSIASSPATRVVSSRPVSRRPATTAWTVKRGEDTVAVFVESFAPPPRMIIFGAVDFTRALAAVAKVLGYRVVVCDARAVFATRQRFPMADEVVNEWPNRYLEKVGEDLGPRDAVCVLTHDSKFDVPAIVGSLATRVGYLGAMGSRKTHAKRTERLQEAGVTDEELARIHAPIGLDIGARTPEETAVSICAEIISARTGRKAQALRDASGPIHS